MTACVTAGALLVAAFVVLGLVVRGAPPGPDELLGSTLHDVWRGPVGALANVVSGVLGPVLPVLLMAALLFAAVARRRQGDVRTAGLLAKVLVLLLVCRATSWLAKPLFARDRPRVFPDFSYPSGHVVSVASTGFAVVVLCLWLAPAVVSRAAWIAAAATALCAASRMVLDVHWLTDTVGAVLVVTGAGLLSGAALRLLPATRHGVASSA